MSRRHWIAHRVDRNLLQRHRSPRSDIAFECDWCPTGLQRWICLGTNYCPRFDRSLANQEPRMETHRIARKTEGRSEGTRKRRTAQRNESGGGTQRRRQVRRERHFPSFADIPEEIRQDMVWGKILEKLDDYEQRRVEFIFTPSPQEEITSREPLRSPKKSAKRP